MTKFAIVDTLFLSDAVKSGQEERRLLNGQAILRINEQNKEFLKNYVKYTDLEIQHLDLTRSKKFVSVLPTTEKNSESVKELAEMFIKLYNQMCNK